MVVIEPVKPSDASAWLRMRCSLWSDGSETEHLEEIEQYFSGRFPRYPWDVLVAKASDGRTLGFVELSVRAYAEGCQGDRVAYLEGWYVEPEARQQGVGRALVLAAEKWGRELGLTEFGSDADPANMTSLAAHRALGFEDAGTIQCFRKKL